MPQNSATTLFVESSRCVSTASEAGRASPENSASGTQLSLQSRWDAAGKTSQASDLKLNASVAVADRARLSRQCVALLDRLRKGALTNVDAAVGFFGKDGKIVRVLNLTARVSELRQAGHDVRATRIEGGLFRYDLRTP